MSYRALGVAMLITLASLAPPAVSQGERALDEVKERGFDFKKVPVELSPVVEGKIWRATGASNTYLVQTSAGGVLIDSGLSYQTKRQMELLESVLEGPLLYILLTHSHSDHVGGVKRWLAKYPKAKVVAHEAFVPMHHELTILGPYYGRRGQVMLPNLVASGRVALKKDPLLEYGGIEPDLLVDNDEPLTLEVGDTRFELEPMPAGEGPDGMGVWIEEHRILFTGDLTGPHFPMWPNLYSVRGERYREFLPYIASLERAMELDPAIVAHGHFDVIYGEDYLRKALKRQRDAVRYVHDAVVDAMNQGKSLPEVMREVTLPEELTLSQGYGKVDWSVRGLWETYTGWFDFESTTGLYPVPARDVYADLVLAAGGPGPILEAAQARLANGEPVHALHLIEVAEAAKSTPALLLPLKLRALEALRERAVSTYNSFFEVSWLDARIAEVRAQLD
jgi:glyoxylase-like metal-dependent hydrolase (beta-lactamase superfamily II)